MTDSLFIATTDRYSGKSLVSLGITDLVLRRTSRVGVFRPIISAQHAGDRDKNIDLLLSHFKLDLPYESTWGFLLRDAADLIGQGRYDEIVDTIIEKYKTLEAHCDFILCIGSDLEGDAAALEFDFNADIARNPGTPVLLVASGANRDPAGVVNTARAALDAYEERSARVMGLIVNRADPEHLDELRQLLKDELPQDNVVLAAIPAYDTLSRPTLREIVQQLDAEILYGAD